MSKYQEILDYVNWYQKEYPDKEGNKPTPIFEIMLFEYPNKEMIYHKSEVDIRSGWPDIGSRAHMGFYYELDTAIRAMNENWCDIHEGIYYAGFVLCQFPGLYNVVSTEQRIYFIWDKEKEGFFEVEEPKIFQHVAY